MQERRLGAGDTNPVIGSSKYDSELQGLLSTTPGMDAGQLYTLFASDKTLTEKESNEAWARAQVIATQKPTEVTETTPEEPAQISNNKDLANRISSLAPIYEKSGGGSWKVDLRKALVKEGFSSKDVSEAKIPGGTNIGKAISTGVSSMGQAIYDFIFLHK